jgi:hypothetical protein
VDLLASGMTPHVQGSKLVGVLDLALDPPPGPCLHDQDPDVVEDVGGAAAAAENELVARLYNFFSLSLASA